MHKAKRNVRPRNTATQHRYCAHLVAHVILCRNTPVYDVVLWHYANLRLWSLNATTVTKLVFLNTTVADTCCGNAATVKLNFHIHR